MEIEKQYITLAQRLRELREEKGIPQFKIAQDLDIHKNTYQGYESAVRRLSLEALDKLAFYFNVSIDYLLGRTDIRTPYPYNEKEFYILYGKVPKRASPDSEDLDKEVQQKMDFEKFLESLDYSVSFTEEANGEIGYMLITDGNTFYKLPYDELDDFIKNITKYINFSLSDYEVDEGEWDQQQQSLNFTK